MSLRKPVIRTLSQLKAIVAKMEGLMKQRRKLVTRAETLAEQGKDADRDVAISRISVLDRKLGWYRGRVPENMHPASVVELWQAKEAEVGLAKAATKETTGDEGALVAELDAEVVALEAEALNKVAEEAASRGYTMTKQQRTTLQIEAIVTKMENLMKQRTPLTDESKAARINEKFVAREIAEHHIAEIDRKLGWYRGRVPENMHPASVVELWNQKTAEAELAAELGKPGLDADDPFDVSLSGEGLRDPGPITLMTSRAEAVTEAEDDEPEDAEALEAEETKAGGLIANAPTPSTKPQIGPDRAGHVTPAQIAAIESRIDARLSRIDARINSFTWRFGGTMLAQTLAIIGAVAALLRWFD